MKNENKKNFWLVGTFIIFVIFILVGNSNFFKPKTSSIKNIELAGQNIKVELALTLADQEKGLGGRASLGENQGMLFAFDHLDRYHFWMKDMKFPLDMIWIGEDMKVVYIKKDATPESYPQSFGPSISDDFAKYVLEINAGFADKNNLKVGDSVVFGY